MRSRRKRSTSPGSRRLGPLLRQQALGLGGKGSQLLLGDDDLPAPVSGTTTYAYNEHGQLTSQTDARNITPPCGRSSLPVLTNISSLSTR
jgi:hypothetical protein